VDKGGEASRMKIRYWLGIVLVTCVTVGVIMAPHLVRASGYCPSGTCGHGQE